MPRSTVSIIVLAIVTLSLIALGSALLMRDAGPVTGQASGTALVGGPFEMINQDGETVTDADFRGRHMLIFFGFTYCPDICPLTLEIVGAALDELGPLSNQIQPIFVSVDPDRDTPDILQDYLSHFGDNFVGLTGSPEQVANMLSAYRVYAAKTGDVDSGDYSMNHSTIIYLMAPDGSFETHFSEFATPQDLAGKIRPNL